MNRLHLLSRPAPDAAALHCLDACTTGDCLVLLGAALLTPPLTLPTGVQVFARAEEMDAVGRDLMLQHCQPISDDEFVALTETHQPVVSWY